MAPLPIEILPTSDRISSRVLRALGLANQMQSDLQFHLCSDEALKALAAFAPTSELEAFDFLNNLESARAQSRGFHPFLISFTDAVLNGKRLHNTFGVSRAGSGLAVATYFQVDAIIGPDDDSLTGYTLYYLGRYAMGFISPSLSNHDEPRQCILRSQNRESRHHQ